MQYSIYLNRRLFNFVLVYFYRRCYWVLSANILARHIFKRYFVFSSFFLCLLISLLSVDVFAVQEDVEQGEYSHCPSSDKKACLNEDSTEEDAEQFLNNLREDFTEEKFKMFLGWVFRDKDFCHASSSLLPVKVIASAGAALFCGINTWAVAGKGVNIGAAFYTVPLSAMAVNKGIDDFFRHLRSMIKKGLTCPKIKRQHLLYGIAALLSIGYGGVYACNDAVVAGYGFRDFINNLGGNGAIAQIIGMLGNGFYTFALGASFGYLFITETLPQMLTPMKDHGTLEKERHYQELRKMVQEQAPDVENLKDKSRAVEVMSKIMAYCKAHEINSLSFMAYVLDHDDNKQPANTYWTLATNLLTTAFIFAGSWFGYQAFKFVFASRAYGETYLESTGAVYSNHYFLNAPEGAVICPTDNIIKCYEQFDVSNRTLSLGELSHINGADRRANIANSSQGLGIGFAMTQQVLALGALAVSFCSKKAREIAKEKYIGVGTAAGAIALGGIVATGVPYTANILDVSELAKVAGTIINTIGSSYVLPPEIAVTVAAVLLGVTFFRGVELLHDISETALRKLWLLISTYLCFCCSDEDDSEASTIYCEEMKELNPSVEVGDNDPRLMLEGAH